MAEQNVHIFGIRHHGPGSTRALLKSLRDLQPSIVLVEGPADANEAIAMMGDAALQPPVAMLLYVPDQPELAAFYPFAEYSPEWQAVRYALNAQVPVQFIDLPQTHQLAELRQEVEAFKARVDAAMEAEASETEADDENDNASPPSDEAASPQSPEPQQDALRWDPFGHLAAAAGMSDGERWWDQLIESRDDHKQIFPAIAEAVATLRSEFDSDMPLDDSERLREQRREAHMRKCIRAAIKEGHERIAVVCGAWHVPALAEMPTVSHDNDLLKGMPKAKVELAWAPWTYERLASMSGYGAGVSSPEWYHLLWDHAVARDGDDASASPRAEAVTTWLTRVARLMREQDIDASSASVIEAVRLAQTLAAMRGRRVPGLDELDEAALTVICGGMTAPLQLIHRELVIGKRIGAVPEDAPMPPLQRDLMRLQKTLRLPSTAEVKEYDLDLRKPNDLQRSHLLHRLRLLGVDWGEPMRKGSSTSTFHEGWQVCWKPELTIRLIEVSRWGPTIEAAASAMTIDAARNVLDLRSLASILDDAMLANLPDAVRELVNSIDARAATNADVAQLMEAVPPLAQVVRYGNVRQTDAAVVGQVLDKMITRITVGLAGACASLNDDAANAMYGIASEVHAAVRLLSDEAHLSPWYDALKQVSELQSTHGIVIGRTCRLLYDAHVFDTDEAARHMSLRMSAAVDAEQAAAWAEGFLRGSGLILVHDQALWALLDEWVASLDGERFNEVLPLLRRTFSTFEPPERRQMATQAKQRTSPGGAAPAQVNDDTFDEQRARRVLPIISMLLGKPLEGTS